MVSRTLAKAISFQGISYFPEQCDFQAFAAGAEIQVEQAGTEKQVYLADMGNVEEGKQGIDLNAGIGFFQGFRARPLELWFRHFP